VSEDAAVHRLPSGFSSNFLTKILEENEMNVSA